MLNSDNADLWGLFISAFISSTLLPGGSEALLLWMQANQHYHPLTLVSVATIGNTLGGMTSWWIGYAFTQHVKTQISAKASTRKAIAWLNKYGMLMLLFSWLPVIGDALCVSAGYLRFHPWYSAFFIGLGKFARYVFLVWFGDWVLK